MNKQLKHSNNYTNSITRLEKINLRPKKEKENLIKFDLSCSESPW